MCSLLLRKHPREGIFPAAWRNSSSLIKHDSCDIQKIPEEKIAHSHLPADWHVAVSIAHFLGLLRFSIFLLQDFLPHKTETQQTTILLWDANLSVIHLIETLTVLISFSPGRKEGSYGCARNQWAWNDWVSEHFRSPLQQKTQCLIFLPLPPLAIFPLVSMEAEGELQSWHLKWHWPKLPERENRNSLNGKQDLPILVKVSTRHWLTETQWSREK